MIYYHADVFSSISLSGNGLTVIFHEEDLDAQYMQRIAKEFKQFETIFLKQIGENRFRTRIFTVEEELDFAGHPILGAVSTIHEKLFFEESNITAVFELNNKTVLAESIKKYDYYQATMNQGIPEFLGTVEGELKNTFLNSLNLSENNLYTAIPMEVISTGLPYLIVPLSSGIEQAKITTKNFEEQLRKIQSKFVYLLDINRMEGRTWDNYGTMEDVATGSAAGPTGAYLYKYNLINATDDIIINQGSFLGRPSKIRVFMDQTSKEIKVAGDVKIIAKGHLFI